MSTDVITILESGGSRGNSAILRPSRVSRPSSSSAPSAYSCSMAEIIVCKPIHKPCVLEECRVGHAALTRRDRLARRPSTLKWYSRVIAIRIGGE